MLNAKLVVVGGATEGDEFQLSLPAILGRSRSASIPLPHPLVSRQHCELFEKEGQLFVRDLNSTNGTFVGSERVDEEMAVGHGSLLTIGTVTFRAFYDKLPRSMDGFEMATVQHGNAPAIDTTTLTRIETGRIDTSKPGFSVGQKAK